MGEGHQNTWVYLSLTSQVMGDGSLVLKASFPCQIETHTTLLRLPMKSHREAWSHVTSSTQMVLGILPLLFFVS